MKIAFGFIFLIAPLLVSGCVPATPVTTPTTQNAATATPPLAVIKLPEPKTKGTFSLEEALLNRRSIREYSGEPLTLEEVSQLLWAAQGKTAGWGGRTAPSAGGLYPLEVYVVVGNVKNLVIGVYKYRYETHELVKTRNEDVRVPLAEAALSQSPVKDAAIDILISAIYERTTQKYGERGMRYVHMEAGHAAQNIYLQATALDLGTVTIGAFYDDRVKDVMGMPENEAPLYIMPVGRKK